MRVQRRRPVLVLILFLSLLSAAAQTQAPAPVVMTVTRPVANMYSAATPDADVVSQAIYATSVTVLETKEGWARVRTPDDYSGWIEASALRSKPSADPKLKLVRVTSLFAHIYREPDVTRHQPLLTLPFETQLQAAPATVEGERWMTVRLLDGTQGMIQAGDVTAADSKPLTIDETIALSRRFLGLPYTWGGSSSYGYDCSGFVQMLMRQRGILIPRDADLQAAWSGFITVERKDLRPGDLLYFGSAPDNVTHTGMYIGNDQFINSTTYQTPMVRIDTLAEPRWTRLLVGIRRPKS